MHSSNSLSFIPQLRVTLFTLALSRFGPFSACAGTVCKQAKMRSIDAQTKHADVHSDTPATADAEKPRTSDAEQLGHDGCSGVPQVTEVSTQVASFCKSMERYTVRGSLLRHRLGDACAVCEHC